MSYDKQTEITNLYIYILYVLGFDGGMNQTFHITVKERENGIVMYDDSNLLKV